MTADSLARLLRARLLAALLEDARTGWAGRRTRRDRARAAVPDAVLEAALLREGVLRTAPAPETLDDDAREARALRAAAAVPELVGKVWYRLARDVESRALPAAEDDYADRSTPATVLDDQAAAAETARRRAIVARDAMVDRVLTMLETGEADSVAAAAKRLGVTAGRDGGTQLGRGARLSEPLRAAAPCVGDPSPIRVRPGAARARQLT
jgi:hypothetical protein